MNTAGNELDGGGKVRVKLKGVSRNFAIRSNSAFRTNSK